ncbi:N-hydroxyarylamine O-acetyltransferase [Melaminivora alkalimesophila]|uniref:N-hydroxyarylamine O-acetyltransferase n=2 Tax=Melaminivora alkalimesophila TaxID=1165852 RepID=A0A317RFI7_9BURK|nr:N-hydroxyarylamine O-acetyltransferase [Melaminivora alkalimesophila]
MIAPMQSGAYLTRIGHEGPAPATVQTLHALTRAHTQAIPFENIDVLLGRPVRLESAAVFDKLVHQRRGGYCFEQNGLFLRVLQELGFSATGLGARVRLCTPDRSEIPARTHLLVCVELQGERWLTDVGFGALSLTQALRWEHGLVQDTPHDRRRLVHEDGRWFHQVWQEGGWVDVYEFTGEPMPESDRKVANWYTSTHPESTFMGQLMVARALPDGGRLTMVGNELRRRHPDGHMDARPVAPEQLHGVLLEHFGIRWPGEAAPSQD